MASNYKSTSIYIALGWVVILTACHPYQWEDLPRVEPECPIVNSITPTGGSTGTLVTVKGQHFDPDLISQFQLKVGESTVAIEQIIDNSTLTFTIPATMAGGEVVVERKNCSGTSQSTSSISYHLSIVGTGVVYAGSKDNSTCDNCLNGPQGLEVDHEGNLYIADLQNQVIQKVTPSGIMDIIAGQKGTSGDIDHVFNGRAGSFADPTDVTVDAVGNVYVVDRGNNSIRKITVGLNNNPVSTIANIAGAKNGQSIISIGLDAPSGISTLTGDTLYISDYFGGSLWMLDIPNGTSRLIVDSSIPMSCRLNFPGGLSVVNRTSGYSFHVALADTFNGLVKGFKNSGLGCDKVPATSVSPFTQPADVEVDQQGNIFVADQGSKKLFVIYRDGTVSPLGSYPFDQPSGIALDETNRFIYVADKTQHVVVQFQYE